jgi:hypothetical protein
LAEREGLNSQARQSIQSILSIQYHLFGSQNGQHNGQHGMFSRARIAGSSATHNSLTISKGRL